MIYFLWKEIIKILVCDPEQESVWDTIIVNQQQPKGEFYVYQVFWN